MTSKLHWTKRQHSAHVTDRFFSGGWEFDTAAEAREYVSDQFRRQTPEALRMSPFRGTVRSNGVHVTTWAAIHSSGLEVEVSTRTYRKGATMRDTTPVPSPSDCTWLVPTGAWC